MSDEEAVEPFAPEFATGTTAWINYAETPEPPPVMAITPLSILVAIYTAAVAFAVVLATDTGWWALLALPAFLTGFVAVRWFLSRRGRQAPAPLPPGSRHPWSSR